MALVAGGLVLFLEMWTVIPAPTLATLTLAAVIPELTPWAVGCCLVAGAFAQIAARGWPRDVGVLCSALALGCALLPWCLLPSTLANCEIEMHRGLGAAYPPALSIAQQALFSSTPYRLTTAIAGFSDPGIVRTISDAAVRTRDGQRLGLDVYASGPRGRRPTVIIVYGGAWLFGNRADSAPVARSLARLGYTAIALDYRHAPVYRFPTQIDDIQDGLAAVAKNAAAWDVDPRRVALLGRSSGAELALLAAYEPGPLTVRAAIGYYAPTDLLQGYTLPPRPDPADVRRILRAYLGGSPPEFLNAYLAASPLTHVRPGLPPTLLIGAGRDELVRLAFIRHMRDALRLHGVRVAELELPWSNHAFDSIGNGTGGQVARYFTERFLAATL